MIVIELADCSLSDRLAKEECSQESLIGWAHEVSMAMVRSQLCQHTTLQCVHHVASHAALWG